MVAIFGLLVRLLFYLYSGFSLINFELSDQLLTLLLDILDLGIKLEEVVVRHFLCMLERTVEAVHIFALLACCLHISCTILGAASYSLSIIHFIQSY